ncbi:MAG: hypothetical protein B6226_05325 [Candidatus Cloacimonetes bacterium 4572_65]|nr:MAG: hypothetical protein B6226_05325 [Candidatus Cloacimonetes bacterium 4572_65]
MSSVLAKMKRLKREKETLGLLKEHPIAVEKLDVKKRYLNGIALMMSLSEHSSVVEHVFYDSLIDVFEVGDLIKSDFLKCANELNDKDIKELFKELSQTNKMKFCFVIDSILIANRDGKMSDDEKYLLNLFIEMLNFKENEAKYLISLRGKSVDYFDYEEEFCRFEKIKDVKQASSTSKQNDSSEEELSLEEIEQENQYRILQEKIDRVTHGDVALQIEIGVEYMLGENIPVDKLKSLEWLRKAAENGSIDAMNQIVELINSHVGCNKIKDEIIIYKEGLSWLKKLGVANYYGNRSGYKNRMSAFKKNIKVLEDDIISLQSINSKFDSVFY